MTEETIQESLDEQKARTIIKQRKEDSKTLCNSCMKTYDGRNCDMYYCRNSRYEVQKFRCDYCSVLMIPGYVKNSLKFCDRWCIYFWRKELKEVGNDKR